MVRQDKELIKKGVDRDTVHTGITGREYLWNVCHGIVRSRKDET